MRPNHHKHTGKKHKRRSDLVRRARRARRRSLRPREDARLPRGGNEWDRVRDQYNAQHALLEGRDARTTDSLKSRFRHVLPPAASSGKTRCSALRTMAVEILQRIMNKVHNVTVDDSQSLEERSDNDEYDENSASEHNEDSETQSNVNSLPSTKASGAAEADSTSQPTEQQRPKRSRGNREIQSFLSVQNASLQEANTALTNRLIALTSELDSKRERISDLRDEKQQLMEELRRNEDIIRDRNNSNRCLDSDNHYLANENRRLHDENVNLLEPALQRQQAGYQATASDHQF
ncbi:hypothetical protein F443_19627 [Phytophthora nicotianae P1569]|uniref:Uncharacterized protein n=1 Tax=Phytophthora nicotianae P1569 TaxID=1317065 RepID=V9E3K5_PHYNI|nr:hypothetical protein F443_19627 [Phytophthora nicotianae P1569]